MARGFKQIKKYNDENTGLPFKLFQLKEEGQQAVVRILTEDVVGLQIHQEFQKLRPTRCVSEAAKDPDNCPLCRVGATRSMRTFIPVRVRGDEDESRVQIIEYGAKALNKVTAWIDEIEEEYPDNNITHFDFKVKRLGTKKDTEYSWTLVPKEQPRPLTEEEAALEVPDIDKLIPVLGEEILEKRAREYAQAGDVTPVERESKKATTRF